MIYYWLNINHFLSTARLFLKVYKYKFFCLGIFFSKSFNSFSFITGAKISASLIIWMIIRLMAISYFLAVIMLNMKELEDKTDIVGFIFIAAALIFSSCMVAIHNFAHAQVHNVILLQWKRESNFYSFSAPQYNLWWRPNGDLERNSTALGWHIII